MHWIKAALGLGALLVGFKIGLDINRRYFAAVTGTPA